MKEWKTASWACFKFSQKLVDAGKGKKERKGGKWDFPSFFSSHPPK
jgi:hypothetical protein